MKKTVFLIASLLLCLGFVKAQDVYFSGNDNLTGKIWKNNTLIHTFSDTVPVQLRALNVANDSSVYSAGHILGAEHYFGRVWLNDSCLFTTDTNNTINQLILNGESWMAAGGNKVWQNGTLLYEYPLDSVTGSNVYALALDTVSGDIYSGGSINDTVTEKAALWKNNTLLWQEESPSSIVGLAFDGSDLYAAGYFVLEGLVYPTLWKNDSIIFNISGMDNDALFTAVAVYDSSVYLAGFLNDSLVVWQDGEVLFGHEFTDFDESGLEALLVNEFGVYYAGKIDGTATIWKDGEILYQPEGCSSVNAISLLPPPIFTLTVEADTTGWGTVSGGGDYYLGATATIEAFPNIGFEFLYWNDSITDNPRDILITQDSTFTAYFGQIDYLIETMASPEDAGTVTEGGIYHYGDTLTLEATANLGFVFVCWNDSITDNPRDIIVMQDSTFTALFETQQCTVTTEVTPESAGSIAGAGIYDYGTTLTIELRINTGYEFMQWSDGVTDNPRNVVVESDTTFTAECRPLPYEITTAASPEHGGTVTGAGTYLYGETATLTATANEYFMFLCWSDGITSNPRNITVTQDATYTALFHQTGSPDYILTVVANDPTLGEVTGSGIYPEGTTVEISATPAFNALFDRWDDGVTDNPRSVTVTEDMTLTAIFTLLPSYTIVVESADPELGSVYGGGIYYINSVITIGATPNEGYHFNGWDDGDMNNPRTVTVTENATYTAIFSEKPASTFTITIYFDENQGFILGAGTYAEGSIATIAAIPADDYEFVKWSDGVTDNPREIVVNQDIVLAAFFNTTGVDENGNYILSLYPIPTRDKLHIEGLEAATKVEVYSAQGQLVKRTTLSGDGELYVAELPAGLYFVRVGRYSLKFVKQ